VTLSVVNHGMTELNKLIFYSFQTFNLKSLQNHNLEGEKKHFKLQAGPTYVHSAFKIKLKNINKKGMVTMSRVFIS
jgi:hypothetical protein